jgi:diguanylate cyclase (GGDEF)-like protein
VVVDGGCVGAVSLESREDLPQAAIDDARCAADVLARAIALAGGMPPPSMGQRLARLAVQLSAETDVELVRALTVEGAVEISGRSSAALSMVDRDGSWETCAVTGPLGPALAGWDQAELALVARWVAAGTSSHFPGGAPVAPGYDFLLRSGVRSIGVQPLVALGSVTGVLAVADAEPRPHDTAAVAALELLASVAASCLRTAALVVDLAVRATHDPLTGLRNLAEFRDHLAAACVDGATAERAGATCMVVDVDHFKSVNYTRGHEAGDEVLRRLATLLQEQLRDEDRLYRVGGDEFAVLIGTGRRDVASAVADRLVAVASRSGVSVSIGWAPVDGTPAAVREAADQALYRAKDAGRGVHRGAG